MTEEWRPIAGASFYEVSNLGRVRSFRPLHPKHPRRLTPIVLSSNRDSVGYARAKIRYDDGRVLTKKVSQLVCEAWNGPRPFTKAMVRHLDGNNHNDRFDNLKWGTAKENKLDSIKHGTWMHGESHHAARITKDQVIQIRTSNEDYKVLSSRFGVGTSMISHIKTGRRWKNLPTCILTSQPSAHPHRLSG